MAKQDRIGVVTVTYNSASVLPEFLRCVMEQTHQQFLLFAVDNASKDDTLRLLHECSDDRLRIIANPCNRGVAAGNNQGIVAALEAGCSSVLLLNNDTEFDAALFTQLDAQLDQKQAEMVCPKIMYYDEPERIWAAGGTFQPWIGYRSVHLGEGEVDHGQYDRARIVTYVPTCCVLIRKAVFEKVGMMDERYFVYVDDTDFMYRAMRAGVKLMYLPEAKLLHKVGRLTGGEDSPFNIRYNTRNRVYFMLQHLGTTCSLPILMLYQIYYAAGLLRGKFSLHVYGIKQRAVLEGIKVWKDYRLAKEDKCQR
jgi:GT2 family glycosyltransferase